MLRTRFTESSGVRHPIASAGMAFVATTPLTNAVCAAGGFGVLGSAGMPPDVLRGAIRDIRQAGHSAFGVNIIPCFATAEHVAVCAVEVNLARPITRPRFLSSPRIWFSRSRLTFTGNARLVSRALTA